MAQDYVEQLAAVGAGGLQRAWPGSGSSRQSKPTGVQYLGGGQKVNLVDQLAAAGAGGHGLDLAHCALLPGLNLV